MASTEIKKKIKETINFAAKFREWYPDLYCSTGNSFNPFLPDTKPSFTLYDDHGCDFGNDKESYDIFNLRQLKFGEDFQTAFAALKAEAGIIDPVKISQTTAKDKKGFDPWKDGEIVATYDYRDASGQLLYQNLRFKPKDPSQFPDITKDFRPRRPDTKNPKRWIRNLKDTTRLPFGLPEMLAASENQTLFLCEGEKDALAMREMGLVATSVGTATTGPDNLEKHKLVDYFKGRDVVFVQDKDEDGRKYAAKAAPILANVAASLKIIEMPGDGIKDPADLYAAHGMAAKDTIAAAVAFADEWKPGIEEDKAQETSESAKSAKKKKKEKAQSEQAVELLEIEYGLKGWQTPEGDSYVTLAVDDHYCFYNVKGAKFKSLLRNAYRSKYGVTLKSNSCKDALDDVESICEMSHDVHELHVRFFYDKNKVAIDLCDPEWNQIEITSEGYEVKPQTEPRFKRVAETLPLPKPEYSEKAIDEFLKVLTISEDSHKLFIKCWIIVACIEGIPRPIFLFNGAPGAAKSSLATAIRDCVDPNLLDRLMPNFDDLKTLKIVLAHCGIVALDQQAGLQAKAVNLLCGVATGAVLADRTLYFNDELTVEKIKKPVIMTSIAPSSIQPDYLDRSLIINRERIKPEQSKTEEDVNESLKELRPKVLGWICDTLSKTIKIKQSGLTLTRPTRMHDFALWAEAAARAMGYEENVFLDTYRENIRNISQSIALDKPLVFLIEDFLSENIAPRDEKPKPRSAWTGKGTPLLNEIRRLAFIGGYDKHDIPKSANALSRELTQLSPSLLNHGITVKSKDTNKGTEWNIKYVTSSSEPPQNVLPFPTTPNVPGRCNGCEFNGGEYGCKYDPADATPISKRTFCPKDKCSLTSQSM